MKKHFLYLSLFFLIAFCYGETKTDLFKITFINKSAFDLEIVLNNPTSKKIEATLKPNEQKALSYSNSNNSYYFYVRYLIPIGDKFFPFFNGTEVIKAESKNASNQEITIYNPEESYFDLENYFVIISNTSFSNISITNSSSRQSYKTINSTTTIPKNSKAVYSSTNREFFNKLNSVNMLAISADKEVAFPYINYKNGNVYSFTYDGTRIYQTDIRPIWKINEPSWKLPIPKTFTPYHILTDFTTERYILAGTEDECGKLVVLESNGTTSWIKNYESKYSYFLSADVNSKGDILVGGQLSDHGLLVSYDKDGAELSNESFAEVQAIWKIKNISENLFCVSGFDEDGDAFCWLVKTDGNKIQITKKIKLPIPKGCVGSNFALYAKNNDCILAINSVDSNANDRELTQLYKIDFENESSTEINLNQKINYITGICVTENNQIFVSGDVQNSLGTISSAILKIKENSIETFYTAPETNSSFSSMYYSEDLQELVCSGFINSEDTIGTAGTPIVRGVSLQSAKLSWENKFGEYNVSDLFCPALDYGYLISNCFVYTNAKHESEILRVNSSGTLSENYITVKFKE